MNRDMCERPMTEPAVLSRRAALALAAGGGVAMLAGCADLPTNGPVTSSDAVPARGGRVVQTAARPRDGAGPEEIVSGFLRACVAGFSDDFATARTFLHPVASDAWDPAVIMRAYAGSTTPVVERDDSGAVRVVVELVGSIDSSGVLTSDGSSDKGANDYTASYSLATDALGQWRIIDLPAGVLLPAGSLSTNYAATSLYFLTPDRTRFVPELRWLPRQDLARAVVTALLAGPAGWLAPGTSSALPEGTGLAGEGVTVDGQTVTVTLDDAVAGLDERERSLMAAQLSTTLSRIEGISSVVVMSGGRPLGDPARIVEPDAAGGTVVGMSAGAVVQGTSSTRRTLATAQALGAPGATHPGMGPDGSVYALNGSSLLRLRPGEGTAGVIASAGSSGAGEGGLLPPVVDRYGWAWTAVDGVLIAVGDLGQRIELDASWLQGREVVMLDLSAESARVALRHRPAGGTGGDDRVSVAVISREENGTPQGLGTALPLPLAAGPGITGLAWSDPVNIVVLAPSKTGQQPLDVRHVQVGGVVADVSGVQGARALASDRVSGAVLLTDDRGQVWQRKGEVWRVLTTEVSDVAYPLP